MEKDLLKLTSIKQIFSSTPPSDPSQNYLFGVRGCLVIQSFLWVFLRTFVPTAVKDSQNPHGPFYQDILRKTLSVLFWNETLIYSAIVILSARTICIPFLQNHSRTIAASSVFRRGIRLWFPIMIALAIVMGTFALMGTQYIQDFADATGNKSIENLYEIPNALAYFNSVFNVFWTTQSFNQQAASLAFPTQTLWIVSVIFEQSYTVYMTMITIPYVRPKARVIMGSIFIMTAWWVQSWAWFTITGLLLADAVINMSFLSSFKLGIPLGAIILPSSKRFDRYRSFRLPSWVLYACLLVAGLTMQYLWTDYRPDLEMAEVRIHTGIYYMGGLNDTSTPGQPLARDDNYLVLLGFFLWLEGSEVLQWIFKNPLFLYLGQRSFSWFLVQSTIIYTAGIKLFMHLHESQGVSSDGSVIVCFIVCLLSVIAAAEIFYRCIDLPSQKFAHASFAWIKS